MSEYSFLKVLRVFHICFRSKSGVIFFSYTFLRYRADQERNIPIRYLHVRYQKGRKIISFARMTNVPLMKFWKKSTLLFISITKIQTIFDHVKKSFCRSITYRYLDLKRTKTETSYISDISNQIYNINLFTILMQCCIFKQSRQFYQICKSKKVWFVCFQWQIEVTDKLLIPNLHINIRFYMYISYSKVWFINDLLFLRSHANKLRKETYQKIFDIS